MDTENMRLFLPYTLKDPHYRDSISGNEVKGLEVCMAVTYRKLFHLPIDRGLQPVKFTGQAGFSAALLARLRLDHCILDSIEKVFKVLSCGVDDVLEFDGELKKGQGDG